LEPDVNEKQDRTYDLAILVLPKAHLNYLESPTPNRQRDANQEPLTF
jgi:hypothetical protein